jgi:very-short-patch-repair endonuclease
MRGYRSTELIFDRQEGVATRAQLLAAGLGEDAIDHRLRTGRYRSEHEGVYFLGPLSMRGRLVAALLSGGDEAALCHASAFVPYRLRTHVVTIDVALPRKRRKGNQLRFHRLILDDSEVTRRDGFRVTTIERTLFDIAATGADIRRVAREAIAKRMTSQRRLSEFAERHKGERGAPALRKIAGEPHTRSKLERKFLRFLADNGFPEPLTNHPFDAYTADVYWPEYQLVVEVDEDAHKLTFEEDRARDRHYAGLGLRAMRVTEASLREESVLREEVRRAARIVR